MTEDELEALRERRRAEIVDQIDTEPVPDEPVYVENTEQFRQLVDRYSVVLVDFFADWCGPCKMLEPHIDALAKSTDAVMVKVDIDSHGDLAASHGVRGVPTLVLYVDGEPERQLVGMQDRSILQSLIEQHTA